MTDWRRTFGLHEAGVCYALLLLLAALVKLGLLLACPAGEPDKLRLAPRGGPWRQVPLAGGWFPDAFVGPMASLQRFAAGEDAVLATRVEDAWTRMALVETAYRANAAP